MHVLIEEAEHTMTYVTTAQRYDVIVVGDVATDVIIRLPEGRIHQRTDADGRWLELPFGEKLAIERDETVAAGGSAANAAVALARLGCRVGVATFLAQDHLSFDLLGALHAEQVDTRLVHVDSPAHTNRNFVLSFQGDRTMLVRDGAFNYHWPHLRPNELPAWLYLTSLGRGALEYQEQIADWLEDNPAVRLAFQPGTFQIEAGHEQLKRIYQRADLVLCDVKQASEITASPFGSPVDLLAPMLKLGCRQVVVSSETGSGAGSDGTTTFIVPPFPDSTIPFDRTGAQDAFASTVVGAFLHGVALGDALRWGAVNFMSVSHELGSQAGLLEHDDVVSQLEEAGESFVAVVG